MISKSYVNSLWHIFRALCLKATKFQYNKKMYHQDVSCAYSCPIKNTKDYVSSKMISYVYIAVIWYFMKSAF
jgi:hypothetical protein